jgi:hypothetical protein
MTFGIFLNVLLVEENPVRIDVSKVQENLIEFIY